ncbi:MAG: permease [Halanaerobium sp.]
MLSSLQFSLDYFLNLVIYLIPLFIIATFIVGLIREFLDEKKIKKSLSNKNPFVSHLLAAIFGAITPFCSCSTIPLLVGMLNSGVPFSISMTFLLASPLANYIAIAMLATLISWQVAVLYVIFIIVLAMIGGTLLNIFGLEKHLRSVKVAENNLSESTDSTINNTGLDKVFNAFKYSLTFFKDLAPYLLIGMLIGALIHGFVPEEFIINVAGPGNIFAVPIAAIIGAPIYLSMEAMIPIAYSFYGLGMAIGTVLALLVGGSGISIPNMVIIARVFKRKLLISYAFTIILIATIIGYTFNYVYI